MSKLALLVASKKLVRSQFAAQQFPLLIFLCISPLIVSLRLGSRWCQGYKILIQFNRTLYIELAKIDQFSFFFACMKKSYMFLYLSNSIPFAIFIICFISDFNCSKSLIIYFYVSQ